MHMRRWSQEAEIFRHSSHPGIDAGSSVTVIWSRCVQETDTGTSILRPRRGAGTAGGAATRDPVREVGQAVAMADVELLIRGAEPCDVAVDAGRIVATAAGLELSASEVVDAAGLHVFPGVVDAHVHFNDPGRADWEGWATGTAAAAAGGTTCVIDMPLNAHPPTLDATAFRAKVAAASQAALTDFALWGGLVPGNVHRLAELAEL